MFELGILDFLQTLHNPLLDKVMVFFTHLGDIGIIWILMIIILLINKKTRKVGVVMSFALVLNLLVCNVLLKNMFLRPRPFTYNDSINLLIPAPLDYSFPSGHTSSSFACAMCLFFTKNKKLFSVSLIMAILIAFSRMYLYVHFPTDIIGGMVVGILCAYISYRFIIKYYDIKGIS